jgi:hypothetical protein
VSVPDAGVHHRGPVYVRACTIRIRVGCGRVSVWGDGAGPGIRRARAPPCGDACDGPGGGVHVVEVRGGADDLVARDDDVRGEGPDGRVSPASEEAEPIGSDSFVMWCM